VNTSEHALQRLSKAWHHIVDECRACLGSELHYQAVVYHCLRQYGQVPVGQIGMNVKMLVKAPASTLFQSLNEKKHHAFRGGFEPIPDVCLFSPEVESKWRRREYETSLKSLILAIEIKASERQDSRLSPREIIGDICKLSALREEAEARGSSFLPVVMIIDTAPDEPEQMTEDDREQSLEEARKQFVGFFYVSRKMEIIELPSARTPSTQL
jgi:hypothetical protein